MGEQADPARTAPGAPRASQGAADRLRELIQQGGLGPGDRLPVVRDLAHQLGVSRSTVREAIRSLRSTGLLDARQGSGTYVTDLEPQTLATPFKFALERSGTQIVKLFEVRAMLEIGAARLATEHVRPADLDALRTLNARIPTTAGPAAMLAADWRFHRRIHLLSGNDLLVQLLDNIAQLGRGQRLVAIARTTIRERSSEQHAAVIEALASGDPVAAARAMRLHLEYVRDTLIAGAGIPDAGEGDVGAAPIDATADA